MLQTAMMPMLEATATDEQIFTDAQLLTLVASGEGWALSEIYARYAGLVFMSGLHALNDQASAEEIVQQVFTKVWHYAREYRVERGKFSTWVRMITRHLCIDEWRHRRAYLITNAGSWESLDRLPNNDASTQNALDLFEWVSVHEALQQIPVQQRIVIELAFWGGMTQQEIAQYCHAPLGTIKTRLRLGMRRLKLLLQESV